MKSIGDILLEEIRNFKPEESVDHKKLLVVDDDPDFGHLICESLQNSGCEVTNVQSPEQALETLRSHIPYSHIFLDLSFPGHMSGIKALEKIKAIFPKTPVTIISGFIDDAIEEEAKRFGFDVVNKTRCLDKIKQIADSI